MVTWQEQHERAVAEVRGSFMAAVEPFARWTLDTRRGRATLLLLIVVAVGLVAWSLTTGHYQPVREG
jgi:hypothetical protein